MNLQDAENAEHLPPYRRDRENEKNGYSASCNLPFVLLAIVVAGGVLGLVWLVNHENHSWADNKYSTTQVIQPTATTTTSSTDDTNDDAQTPPPATNNTPAVTNAATTGQPVTTPAPIPVVTQPAVVTTLPPTESAPEHRRQFVERHIPAPTGMSWKVITTVITIQPYETVVVDIPQHWQLTPHYNDDKIAKQVIGSAPNVRLMFELYSPSMQAEKITLDYEPIH